MNKSLVIVESPAKAKKINSFLGNDFIVMASVGHVRDLPPKNLGVDLEKGFQPEYVETTNGKKILKELKDKVKECEKVFLAPDPDREGEAIAWHLYEALRENVGANNFYRVTYNEITKSAILSAFDRTTKIDMDRVNAQQARRILDRLVGFKGSPVVRRQIRGANSVGRVQTVALRLVVDREILIDGFIPEIYFTVGVEVQKKCEPIDSFILKLARINNLPIGVKDRKLQLGAIKNIEQLENIQKELETSSLEVSDIITKEVTRKARAPFITSTLQQSASGVLGYAPARTMGLAQKLYENGLITYMRTDSFNIAKSAQDECRSFIINEYGLEYLPENSNIYSRKSSAAQEAHEAIRPTSILIKPGNEGIKLETAELKLYKLIWERFVASQMVPARILRRTVEAAVNTKNEYLFRATTSDIIFAGYMKASGIEAAIEKSKQSDDSEDEIKIPPLDKNESLHVIKWLNEEKETKPLSRYSEASLIKALEENGVGRPSTYAAIMSKLDEREYVIKEKRSLIPTNLGKELIGLVQRTEEKHKDGNKIDLFEVNFTADMEKRLDDVEEGRLEWTDMMNAFYPSLLEWIEHAKETADANLVNDYLTALSTIVDWAEPIKSGKKIYDDKKTYLDLKNSVNKGELLSKRQGDLLYKMCCRYYNQISNDLSERLNLIKPEAVRDTTAHKISLLLGVKFDNPNKVGKRVYDDKKFVNSLNDQIALGKRLSDKQVSFLNKLLGKYANQIPDFEEIKKEFNIDLPNEIDVDPSIEPILEMMRNISDWAEPVKKGKREFNDQSFYDSLTSQFKSNKSLSERQVLALKKMAARYATQILDYDDNKDKLGLLEPRKPKEKKATEEA